MANAKHIQNDNLVGRLIEASEHFLIMRAGTELVGTFKSFDKAAEVALDMAYESSQEGDVTTFEVWTDSDFLISVYTTEAWN